MNETSAIKLCLKHKDPKGFEYLVAQYQKRAIFYSFAMMGNQEDAKDACQEAFTKAFGAITTLPRLPAFYPWFVTILRNCCLNMISRKRTSHQFRRTRIVEQQKLHASSQTPESVFIQEESEREIWRCLDRLKTDHKEILVLKYYQDCRYDDISTILGIPKGTVMSRLYAARKAFKDIYDQTIHPPT